MKPSLWREAQAIKPGIPLKKSKKGFILLVKVRPGASRTQIERVEGDTLMVRLTAPPEGGKANEQLIELLSEELGIRKSAIRIRHGRTSRDKTVEIEKS